jgi:hypothetical protein
VAKTANKTAKGGGKKMKNVLKQAGKLVRGPGKILHTMAPVAQSFMSQTGRAIVGNSSGNTIVSHSEYIADVTPTVATYEVTSIPINPGISSTFRWLSTMAAAYEKYRFRSLVFEYRPSVGTATAGTVILSPDYDPTDPAPQTKQRAMAAQGTVRSAVWENSRLDIPLDRMSLERYTRFQGDSSGEDLKLYDLMNLHVATIAAASFMGEIHVTYTIELITPQHNTQEDSDAWVNTTGGSCVATALFGTPGVWVGYGDGTVVQNVDVAQMRILRVGTYVANAIIVGSSLVGAATAGADNTVTAFSASGCINAAGTVECIIVTFIVTSPGQIFSPRITSAGTMTDVRWTFQRTASDYLG